ncbi:MAG: asparagine synthase C-terminal domain-containing protein, partial [Candidatus Aenigmatarchaeota archaeon]
YKSNDNLNRIFYGDIRTNLVNEMLSKVDKMTMANGLEARCPFLDKELVEFTMKLPSKYKINFKGSKYILKQVFLEILPKEILERKKHGFELPINEWLRKGLKNYMLEILSREELKKHNYFNSDYIDFLIKTHLSRKLNLGHHLWAILNFQIWFNIFMQ